MAASSATHAEPARQTVTYLAGVYLWAKIYETAMQHGRQDVEFWPTLIVMPPNIIPQAAEEAVKFFKGLLHVKIFYGDTSTGGSLQKLQDCILANDVGKESPERGGIRAWIRDMQQNKDKISVRSFSTLPSSPSGRHTDDLVSPLLMT